MKFELFVNQPDLGLKKGIKVHKDTETTFRSERVEQVIKDLKMGTILTESGTNGANSFKSESHISITLNEGDVLLFDPQRGYYLPAYPASTIEDAISDISSLKGIKLKEDYEVE